MDPAVLEDVALKLLHPRVANLFSYRKSEDGIREVAEAQAFRLLASYPNHPLREIVNVEMLRRRVRHHTSHFQPVYVDPQSGRLLFPDRQKLFG
jgi:hypothetical protein